MANEQLKIRAINAWNNLMLVMGKKFGLPKEFGIEVPETLRQWFANDDPEKVQKFIEWVERTTKDLG